MLITKCIESFNSVCVCKKQGFEPLILYLTLIKFNANGSIILYKEGKISYNAYSNRVSDFWKYVVKQPFIKNINVVFWNARSDSLINKQVYVKVKPATLAYPKISWVLRLPLEGHLRAETRLNTNTKVISRISVCYKYSF